MEKNNSKINIIRKYIVGKKEEIVHIVIYILNSQRAYYLQQLFIDTLAHISIYNK